MSGSQALQGTSAGMGTGATLAGLGGATAATGGLAAPLAIGALATGLGSSLLGGSEQQAAQQAAAQRQLNEQTMANTAQASQTMGQPNQKALSELQALLPSVSSGLSPGSMISQSSLGSQGYL